MAATTLFFTNELSRAIAVLVVATPTALVVAGPAAVVAAMTVATRLRILIKSADFFERASDVDTLDSRQDRNGDGRCAGRHSDPTVEGRIRGEAARRGGGMRLWIAASCFARRCGRSAGARNRQHASQEISGEAGTRRGRHGRWPASRTRTQGAARELGIDVGSEDDEDVSQVWVAYGGRCLGRFMLRDKPRSEAREALAAMRALGIDRLVLLTGDRAAAAREVGEALGMDEVVAEVLPAQKLDIVRAEQAAGRTVMMVGDGVNDAPALGGADVGVAIGAELNEVALGGPMWLFWERISGGFRS